MADRIIWIRCDLKWKVNGPPLEPVKAKSGIKLVTETYIEYPRSDPDTTNYSVKWTNCLNSWNILCYIPKSGNQMSV